MSEDPVENARRAMAVWRRSGWAPWPALKEAVRYMQQEKPYEEVKLGTHTVGVYCRRFHGTPNWRVATRPPDVLFCHEGEGWDVIGNESVMQGWHLSRDAALRCAFQRIFGEAQ